MSLRKVNCPCPEHISCSGTDVREGVDHKHLCLNLQVVKTSTLTYTWSSSGDASDSFRADVANVLGPYGVKQDITYPNYRQEMMHLSGSHSLTQPVVDRVANATGEGC